MDLDSGEIYFIREQAGGEYTEFTKIGKVAEKPGRSSLDRVEELQTGNPRQLKRLHSVSTTFVDAVETTLHREFAPKRVLPGEWFKLSDTEIASAIARCGELAAANARLIPLFEQAESLGAVPSRSSITPASDDAATWAQAYRRANYGLNLFEKGRKSFRDYLVAASTRGVDVTDFATITHPAGDRSYKELFKETYPEIVSKYSSLTTKVSGQFRPKPFRNEVHSPDEELAVVVSLTNSLMQQVSTSTDQREEIVAMHALYLALISQKPVIEKQKELAKAHLMLLCGDNSGIEDLCTWRRSAKEDTEVDWKTIAKTYPKEVAACTTFGEPRPSLRIKRGSGYGYIDEES